MIDSLESEPQARELAKRVRQADPDCVAAPRREAQRGLFAPRWTVAIFREDTGHLVCDTPEQVENYIARARGGKRG